MGRPKRLEEQAGRFALVDGIPFQLPVSSHQSPALMAAFSIDADKAAALLPGNELHPFRLWNKGLLVIFWLYVLIPLAWGVTNTLLQAVKLFG